MFFLVGILDIMSPKFAKFKNLVLQVSLQKITEFTKFKILSFKWVYKNFTFCKEFQYSKFLEFLMIFEFLEVKKVTPRRKFRKFQQKNT